MPGETPDLPYGRQWVDEADIAAVLACLRGDWLTQGSRVREFEKALCATTGARHAVAVSSGTAALHLAALAADVKPGDTGITSAITFVASANCIAYCGGNPRFVDVDPGTALIDLDALERRVDRLTRSGSPPKIIIPVAFAGQPANLPAIRAIADRCGASVVEDAAHALGGSYDHAGRTFRAGSCAHTDMAILSFHPVKHITTGEGGAVLTNDGALAVRIARLRSHGLHADPAAFARPDEGPWYYEQSELGYNYRLTDIQCALGLSQLARLEAFVARRNELARLYDAALAEKPLAGWATPLQRGLQTVTHAYHLYVIRLRPRAEESPADTAARRKTLYLELRKRGILAQVHYIPVPRQPYYRDAGENNGEYPGANAFYAGCLSLPMYPRMTDADVRRVVEALHACVAI